MMHSIWKKQWIGIVLAVAIAFIVVLCGVNWSTAYAETETEEATAKMEETEDTGLSRGVKIAGFLGIFTVVFVGTAYLTVRPSLKKLKAARQEAESETDETHIK